MKRILIKSREKVFKESNSDNFQEKVIEFIENNIINSQPDFENFMGGISGNLDAKMIRNIYRTYNIHFSPCNGRLLKEVKAHRNKLAHREISFSECGRNYIFSELKRYKEQIFCFLDSVVSDLKIYIENEEYVQ